MKHMPERESPSTYAKSHMVYIIFKFTLYTTYRNIWGGIWEEEGELLGVENKDAANEMLVMAHKANAWEGVAINLW